MAVLVAAPCKANEPFTPPEIVVPQGFVVELAAAPPLVAHPMMAGFDDRGRLFVAESAGMNLKREELEQQLPNFVRMLEDTDGDGRFDKSTIFADKMTLPMGALWHDGALYVAAPPSIWRLEDTDGDGVADKRDVIVDQFGYNGNAASVHGCFLGPAGRIYWCDGRHGHEFRLPDGTVTSKGKAARIFSCRPDGSDVQVHCGGGMDNPVEIDFTNEGEMLGVVNLFYKKRGDCLVHWMRGGVYPRYDQQDCIDEFKQTGELLTEVSDLGHVAVSGVTRYRSGAFGKEYQDDFFVCEFNTHKLVRMRLSRQGSTFVAPKEEFLACDSIDFHPTDVLEDADGSLLLIDTGGWFRIGCPTSQIAKPNILGAIYRIRKADQPAVDDPRGVRIAWENAGVESLADLLDDERFAVRERAIAELAQRGDAATAALVETLQQENVQAQRNAIWALARIATDDALAAVRTMFSSSNPSLRQAAVYSAGVNRDKLAAKELADLLAADEPSIRRAAATALGQIGQGSAAAPLLAGLAADNDRVAEHALIYALIEIDDREATLAGLAHASPQVRRGALIALDQMDHGELARDHVAPLLDTDDAPLQSAAMAIIGRHPTWSAEIVELLGELLQEPALDENRRSMVSGAIVALAGEAEIQSLVAAALARSTTSPATKRLLLEAIGRCDVRPLPTAWSNELSQALASEETAIVEQAVATIGAVAADQFDQRLLHIARDGKQENELRVSALSIVAGRGHALEAADFRLLAAQLDGESPPMLRLAAARALGAAALSREQQLAVAGLIAEAGPLETAPLLAAFEQTSDSDVGLRLAAALSQSSGAAGISLQHLEKLLSNFPQDVQDAAAPLAAKLRAADAQQQAHLANLEADISGGDVEQGRQVFASTKASCSACHRIGDAGGKIGPDLTAIGQRRSARDLLEAILYPSASLSRGFESFSISTADGRVYAGMITHEAADAVHLRTTDQAEVRIRRSDVEEMLPSPTSIMPGGLENTMSGEELRNLVAYLQSLQ